MFTKKNANKKKPVRPITFLKKEEVIGKNSGNDVDPNIEKLHQNRLNWDFQDFLNSTLNPKNILLETEKNANPKPFLFLRSSKASENFKLDQPSNCKTKKTPSRSGEREAMDLVETQTFPANLVRGNPRASTRLFSTNHIHSRALVSERL